MSDTKMGSWFAAYGDAIGDAERTQARGKVIVGILTGDPEPEAPRDLRSARRRRCCTS